VQRRTVHILFLAVLYVSNLVPAPLLAQDDLMEKCSQGRIESARIEAIDANYANLSIRDCIQADDNSPVDCKKCPMINVSVDNLAIRSDLKSYRVGDRIRLDIVPSKNSADNKTLSGTMVLKDFRGAWSTEAGRWYRVGVLGGCAFLILLLATAVTGGHPFKFVIGMDNRYSNSKVQVAFWFLILISTYLAAMFFRVHAAGWDFASGINIPQNLLVLSGLSALTFGGAKAITTSKADDPDPKAKTAAADAQSKLTADADAQAKLKAATKDQAELAAAKASEPHVLEAAKNATAAAVRDAEEAAAAAVAAAASAAAAGIKTIGNPSFVKDLVRNDVGSFDFGDFQMLVVTLLAVATYLLLFLHFFDSIAFTKATLLPDVDTTILSIFGIGQGAYLAKKAAGNAGTS
jgi:hypothetical protein